MLNLNDKKWKEFYIGDLFVVKRPIARSEKQYQDGRLPFVASGNVNNGVIKCCTQQLDEPLDRGNCVTVSPVDGSAFYQVSSFLGRGGAGSSILLLYNDCLNRHSGLFVSRMIRQTCSKYCYGKMGNQDSIKREKIMLPVDEQGNPDYDFMESYIQEQEIYIKEKSITYAQNQMSQLEYIAIPELEEKEWAAFYIDDIFSISSGKRFVSEYMHQGTRPFIGATDSGNGITNFISDTNESLDKNVLGVNYNGNGMVISFYHPYECLFTDDVKRFHLKNHEDNKFILLFMKTVILQQKAKYNYGYKFNAKRMARQIISLPVEGHGNPDYVFMEQYIKNLMLRKFQQYLDYVGV